MYAESFNEMFTDIRKAPESTSEEKERIRKLVKEGRREFLKQLDYINRRLKYDGTEIEC